jgi:two-component system OmpR family sensor kinase
VRHSLRLRLTLACLGLLAVGLVGAGATTYRIVQSSLVDRVDQQLSANSDPVLRTVARQLGNDGPSPGSPNAFGMRGPQFFRNSLVFGAVTASGSVVNRLTAPSTAKLVGLPKRLPGSTGHASAKPRSFDLSIGGKDYRGLAVPWPGQGGGTVVLALPLHDVESTLDEILLVELVAGAIALVAVAVAAWLIVRRGLRPLERMAATATVIAGGDLSQRVDESGDRQSEVGKLGVAFNGMLEQIEAEIATRRESEDRLRRFAADASHELRTPLTSIRGYAELFRRGAADRPEDLAMTMNRIESEATRMTSLVDDLLLLARLDQNRPLDRERVEVGQLVTDVVAGERIVHPDRAYTLTIDEVALLGDEARLRQVLINLLANAASHTPAGTSVDVTVRRENGEAVIEVADHGEGLSEEDAKRVFERFFRVDAARFRGEGGGSGLGLAIVAAIVDAHGGRVEVDGMAGIGARFRVRLPATEPVRQPDREPAPVGV